MASNKKRFILPIIIIAIAIVIMMALFSGRKPAEVKQPPDKALLVETTQVFKEKHQFIVESQGTVMPKINSSLVSQVSGKVIAISPSFVKGGFFKAGDVLVEIEPDDYQTAVKSAQANLARAQATLIEEKAKSKVAEREWQQFMKGKAPDLYLRKPQLAREVANVQAAEADLEKAKRNLSRTKIIATFNGIVKDKQVDLGQFVNMGTPIATLYGTDIAEVRLPVSDDKMAFMSFSTAFEITTQKPTVTFTDVSTQKQKVGTIIRTEGIVDDKNRMVFLVAQINDPYGLEQQGKSMEFGRFVKADIIGKTLPSVAKVKRDYLLEGDRLMVVKDEQLNLVDVTVVKMDNLYTYISNGVENGDKVVTTNLKNPLHGTKVKLVEQMASSGE